MRRRRRNRVRCAGCETLYADFHCDDSVRAKIEAATASGEKHLRWFENEITSAHGTLIARLRKQLYVRRRERAGPGARKPSTCGLAAQLRRKPFPNTRRIRGKATMEALVLTDRGAG